MYQQANISDALYVARTAMLTPINGRRANVTGFVILFTDIGSIDEYSTVTEAKKLQNDLIQIYTIGIGNWFNPYELNSVASFPYSAYVFQISSALNLSSIVNDVKRIVCSGILKYYNNSI